MNAPSANMVVMLEANGIQHFWTGYRFSVSLADAKLYASVPKAKRDRERFPGACVIANYGSGDAERCVFSS